MWVWSLGWEDTLDSGNTLQYSCLGNPIDRGGWRLCIYAHTYIHINSVQSLSHVLLFATPRMQHARLSCSSPTHGTCSNSYPSSWWCQPTISSSSSPSPPAFNLPQHQGLYQWVSPMHQVAKVLEFQLQHQSFQWIFRTGFLFSGLVWSPCSPRDSQESSPTPQFKSINSLVLSFITLLI